MSSEEVGPIQAPIKRPRGRPPLHSRDNQDERFATERGMSEREAEERELSDDEGLEIFRDSLTQSVLPDLPAMPGYHVCWLTTSNPRDSIAWRLRVGYELIRAEEIPGWDGAQMKTGEYSGVVGINEMVAARIPLSRYNRYMREVHHAMPLEQEQKLKTQTDLLKENANRMGARVDEGDGMAEIVQRAKPMPEFDA